MRAPASNPASPFPDLFFFCESRGVLSLPGALPLQDEGGQPSLSPAGQASYEFKGIQRGVGRRHAAFTRPRRPPRWLFITVKTRLYSRRSTNPRRRARSLRPPPAPATSPPRRPPSCLPPQTTRPPAPCRPPPPQSTTQPATARSLPILMNGTFKIRNKTPNKTLFKRLNTHVHKFY